MLFQQQRVALISVQGDPAIADGTAEARGQAVYIRQIGEALARLGWQVDMLTRRTDRQQSAIVQHLPNCRTIRLSAGPATPITSDDLLGYLPEFVQAVQAFQIVEGIQYPLVHTNAWLSAWVAMALKQAQSLLHIHTEHSLGAAQYRSIGTIPLLAKTRLATERACLETADRIVATSPQEQDYLRRLSSQVNVEVIPCGADLARFGQISRLEARQALGIAAEEKVVLYVGRFDPRKGVETAVRAAGLSRLIDRLIVSGSSYVGRLAREERNAPAESPQAQIVNLVQDLNLQSITQFPGYLGTRLPLYYAAADVCVVPSDYEPFGLVAIEAMASRTPVIASSVGGLLFTVIPAVTGLLAPPRQEAAFATAIDRVLSDPEWRDQLGEAGRQRVETMFSWDGAAAQLSKLYKQVLRAAKRSAEKPSPVSA